ncbi:syntaxin-132 [Cucumis melo var. makuwa]|uniref:Syntaxin-132 n=1 Tax=Cucumis melo var. makuwa TaxID=1194695 RepID=A0A5D3D5I9_CUCMM|nr:syntaxin-132 [Cucumis melo var. makuwa]
MGKFNMKWKLTEDLDSFEIPRGQPSRGGDIELGTNAPGDQGMGDFFKKVQEIEKQNEKLDTLLRKLQGAIFTPDPGLYFFLLLEYIPFVDSYKKSCRRRKAENSIDNFRLELVYSIVGRFYYEYLGYLAVYYSSSVWVLFDP